MFRGQCKAPHQVSFSTHSVLLDGFLETTFSWSLAHSPSFTPFCAPDLIPDPMCLCSCVQVWATYACFCLRRATTVHPSRDPSGTSALKSQTSHLPRWFPSHSIRLGVIVLNDPRGQAGIWGGTHRGESRQKRQRGQSCPTAQPV